MKLVKSRVKGKTIYSIKIENKVFTFKFGNKFWHGYNNENKHDVTCKNLKELKKYVKGIVKRYRATKKVNLEGGWRCPKGCWIDSIESGFNETVYGIERYLLNDKKLENSYEREDTESDNYYRDGDATCPICGKEVEWYEPPNSIRFIKDL